MTLSIMPEGLWGPRTRGPERAEELLSRVLNEFLHVREPPETVMTRFYHRLRSVMTVQCEALGVPWQCGEVDELVDMVRLDISSGGRCAIVLPDDWLERVDRLFGVRTCYRCGSVNFRGSHPRDECDAAAVLAVMES